MPILRTYECPDCAGRFQHLHMTRDEPPPEECPLCAASVVDIQPELAAPHIARSIGKVADGVYRAMEETSAIRAEAAGSPALKITDMRDNTRAGEHSAAAVNNPVSQFMAQTGAGGHVSNGAEYARATRSGPYAGAGSSIMQQVTSQHGRLAPVMTQAGMQGKH